MMISCVLLAAGAGKRMQREENKIFLRLGQFSVLQWNLEHLLEVPHIKDVVIVVAEGEMAQIREEVDSFVKIKGLTALPWTVTYTNGGSERQYSVENGVAMTDDETDIILIHDGARPMAESELFIHTAQMAAVHGTAVVAVPAVDTIKRVSSDKQVVETLKRNELYAVQTPQGFKREVLLAAQQYAKETNFIGTDDVSLVEHMGNSVQIVEGEYSNIKITTPSDIIKAKKYLGAASPMMRVGFGYDVHRFKEGRPCILGGVQIDSPIGPDGHSDADVLVHALMDALLGAAGLKDIGYYFPPEDETFRGISSLLLLEKVNSLLKEKGFSAYNIDIMVIAESPKLKPHVDAMKENISQVLALPVDRISIKATTNEKLGALGRQEGIAAQAVVSIYESEDF